MLALPSLPLTALLSAPTAASPAAQLLEQVTQLKSLSEAIDKLKVSLPWGTWVLPKGCSLVSVNSSWPTDETCTVASISLPFVSRGKAVRCFRPLS